MINSLVYYCFIGMIALLIVADIGLSIYLIVRYPVTALIIVLAIAIFIGIGYVIVQIGNEI